MWYVVGYIIGCWVYAIYMVRTDMHSKQDITKNGFLVILMPMLLPVMAIAFIVMIMVYLVGCAVCTKWPTVDGFMNDIGV